MIYDYSFAALLVLLLLGNALSRLARRKAFQFWYNTILLILLMANICLLGGTSSTYLNFASVNPFSTFFMLTFTLGLFLVNILAHTYSQDYANFALLGSFALAGTYMVASANSLVTIFIGLECISVPTAFIMLVSRRQSLEAATKFFIMASFAIAILSFAIVIVYGSSKTLALESLQQDALLLFAAVLFLASLGIQSSVFPFNIFIPDVYEGLPAQVTAMLGSMNRNAGLAAMIQIFILVFISVNFAFAAIAVLALLTMFFGNLFALTQKNFKRMLAYSSISQTGYILIGLSARSASGIEASLFLIFADALLFIGVLGITAWLEKNGKKDIDDLIGLYKESGFAAIALSMLLLSFVGLPLTAGFIGKFLVFASALDSGMLWLVIIGVINIVISVFYFAKVITAVYTNKLGAKRLKFDSATAIVVVVCLALALGFGMYPQPLMSFAGNGANYLFGILAH